MALFTQKSLEGSVVKPCQLVFAPGVRQSGASRAPYLSDLPRCGQLCVTCVEPYFGLESERARNGSHVDTVLYVIDKNYVILTL